MLNTSLAQPISTSTDLDLYDKPGNIPGAEQPAVDHSTERLLSARKVAEAVSGQYSMTTRPSILPWIISSKTALMSPSGRLENVGWIFPAA